MTPQQQRQLARELQEVIKRLTPAARDAVLAAYQSIADSASIDRLAAAIEARNLDAVIAALNIEAAAFSEFEEVTRSAYRQGGTVVAVRAAKAFARMADSTEAAGISVRFDMSNPRAVSQIEAAGADSVAEKLQEVRDAVRVTVLAGYSGGHGPDEIARQLVGRAQVRGGPRKGGVIGLSGPQTEHVNAMRWRLLSGDTAEMSKVLKMTRRDKRFDAEIYKALNDGRPVAPTKVARMVERYSDRLLALRGETIARTEVGMAVMDAEAEAWRQGLEKTGYPPEAVTRTWRHGGGGKEPRASHRRISGQKVQGLDAMFQLPDGTRMHHPLDRRGGPEHVINCTCYQTIEIDYSWGLS